MIIRPQVLLAAHGAPQPRSKLAATGVQIYTPGGMTWSKKALIFRNVPYTATNPTLAQIDVRLKFGEIANAHKGVRGFKNGLPGAAGFIQEEMKDSRSSHSMNKEAYPSRTRRSYHTMDELKVLYDKKLRGKEAAEYFTRYAAP